MSVIGKRLLTGMRSFVNLQILTPGENFATMRKGTRERFFSSVNPNVINEFVLGFEGSAFPRTLLPTASVESALRTADMLHRQMGDDFMHGTEHSTASFLRTQIRIYPHTGQVLRLVRPHVAQESPGAVGCLKGRRGI